MIYEFDISTHWKIHFVMFVIQLKFISNKNVDFYDQLRSNYFDEMKIENFFNIVYWKFYEIKKFINKRIKKFDRIFVIQYFVKWREYDFEYDEWRFIIAFNNVMNLIEIYKSANSSNTFESTLSISSKQSIKKSFNIKTFNFKMTSIKNINKSIKRRERLKKTLIIQHVDAFVKIIYWQMNCHKTKSNFLLLT